MPRPLLFLAVRRTAPWCASWLLACGGETVTIKGSVPGLDSLAMRGDSLLAEANRSPESIDSIRVAAREALERELAESLGIIAPTRRAGGASAGASRSAGATGKAVIGAGTPGGDMSLRAQARGDSMARAFASQWAGGVGTGDRVRGDTLRGRLEWEGTEPARTVVIRAGGRVVSLTGMATSGLRSLVGTEVVVRGLRVRPADLVVSTYLVRAAGGVPAFDGTVTAGGALRLTDGTGVKPVPLPAALRSQVGARVWVAVENGRVRASGVIR